MYVSVCVCLCVCVCFTCHTPNNVLAQGARLKSCISRDGARCVNGARDVSVNGAHGVNDARGVNGGAQHARCCVCVRRCIPARCCGRVVMVIGGDVRL